MTAEDGIRAMTASRNRELLFDALVEFGTGVFFSLLTFGIIFWITWLLGFFGHWPWYVPPAVTGVFAVASIYSAWRRVNPLAGLRQMTSSEELLTQISLATPYMIYVSPEHAQAGAAMALLAGPANVVKSVGTILHRLPTGSALYRDAAETLRAAANGLNVDSIEYPLAVVLLMRLALVKSETHGGPSQVMIVTTEKGREVLAEQSAVNR